MIRAAIRTVGSTGFVLALLLSTSTILANTFGTWCTESYESGWQTTLKYGYDRCSRFNNELDDTDSKKFYFSLNGAKPYIENGSDQVYTEGVNLVFLNTHGGAWSTSSVFAMWNKSSYAYTSNMRLGDESVGTSIFSAYACETLKSSDGRLVTRWRNTMRGGLRIVTGSHSKLYDSITTDEVGEDYADDLQGGMTIKNAWKSALSDWATDQDVAVMATGRTSSECASRRDGMKWSNFRSYSRLRDSSVAVYCWTQWNNL